MSPHARDLNSGLGVLIKRPASNNGFESDAGQNAAFFECGV